MESAAVANFLADIGDPPGEIELTDPQDAFVFCEDPFPALVAGFGSGKTKALVARSLMGKLQYPTLNRAFYEPTYDLMRQIAWPEFEQVLDEAYISYKLYKSPYNYIDIEGCGKIIFRSMDIPSKIIGYQVADSDIDELDTLKIKDAEEIWRRALSRNRQKKPDGKLNTIGVGTTPEGFKFTYNTWGRDPKPGYKLFRAETDSNPHLPDGYIESLRAIYPANLIDAYIKGLFVNLTSGTVYTSYDRVAHRSTEVIKTNECLHIGMDFNVEHMAATISVQRPSAYHMVGEAFDLLDTPAMADLIKERYKDKGHHIVIYPDSSGKNRSSKGASETDISILRSYGFEVRAKMANPPVKDRYQSVNNAFEKGKYFVNDILCPHAADCLEQQAFDKNGAPDKTTGHDHTNDATGYKIYWLMPVVKPLIVTDIRMGT